MEKVNSLEHSSIQKNKKKIIITRLGQNSLKFLFFILPIYVINSLISHIHVVGCIGSQIILKLRIAHFYSVHMFGK